MRGALATLLGLEPDIEVVAQVGTGRQVVDAVRTSGADVALLDNIDMPDGDGLSAAGAIRDAHLNCRCLIVTTFGRPGYLRALWKLEPVGFIVKDTPTAASRTQCVKFMQVCE